MIFLYRICSIEFGVRNCCFLEATSMLGRKIIVSEDSIQYRIVIPEVKMTHLEKLVFLLLHLMEKIT